MHLWVCLQKIWQVYVLVFHNKVREAQEALSESGKPDIELILGGTTLLTPADMYDLLLGDSSYV